MSKRGIRIILTTMGCHLENAEVLRYGCYALEHLSCSGYYGLTSDKNAFETAKGGIHTILTLNRMDSDVQRCGCRVLAHLVKRRCSTITNATAQLGLHLVLTAMQNHPASSDNIHGHASYFLANFAARQRFSRKNEKHIIEAGGVYSILTTMRRYNCEVSIQRRGLVSLHCVAFLPNGRARISFEGGIGVTLATMRRFQSHEGIQRRGSLLLRTLGVLDSFNRAKILCEGGVGVLVDAMREFPSSLKMQRCCLTTLYRLGFCNYPCFAFVSEGGIPVLVNVIREQADDKRIVFSCCQVLLHLAYSSRDNVAKLDSAGAFDAIQVALHAHPRAAMLRWVGTRVLKKIAARKRKELIPKTESIRTHQSLDLLEILFSALCFLIS